MPIKVALQTIYNVKKQEIVPRAALLDRILPIGDASFPLLQYIDEYGNTVFNGRQMPQFLKEWDVIVGMAESGDDRKVLLEIRDIAVRCKDEPHLFLRFIGD